MFNLEDLMEPGAENYIIEHDGKTLAIFVNGGGFVARHIDRFQIAQVWAEKDWGGPDEAYELWDAIIQRGTPGVHTASGTPLEVFEDADQLMKAAGIDHTQVPNLLVQDLESAEEPPHSEEEVHEILNELADQLEAVPEQGGFKRFRGAFIQRLVRFIRMLRPDSV